MSIVQPSLELSKLNENQPQNLYPNLELNFSEDDGVLWEFLRATSTPYFSHRQLNDLGAVQAAISNGEQLPIRYYSPDKLKYIVFGSRIPNVFNLGGDLVLFRDLIERRDRTALSVYARKCTDAVYNHAAPPRAITTYCLVQGVAMGGGFECALSANILVAERGTRMGFPEVLFGLFPGMGAYTFLRRKLDPASAERIILSAKNYAAEELYELGVVDILADPGDGERVITNHIAKERNRPGSRAFRHALGRSHVIDHSQLYGIAEEWVDAAMDLPEKMFRRIDRIVKSQSKFGVKSDNRSPREPSILSIK